MEVMRRYCTDGSHNSSSQVRQGDALLLTGESSVTHRRGKDMMSNQSVVVCTRHVTWYEVAIRGFSGFSVYPHVQAEVRLW